MSWPPDADGDAMRRLENAGFDFKQPHPVDFQIDFEGWPPAKEALLLLEDKYGPIGVYGPEDDFHGYVQCTVVEPVTYEFVTRMQREISTLMKPFGGCCDSWGVPH